MGAGPAPGLEQSQAHGVVGVEAALQVLEQSRSSVTPDLTKKRWEKLLCFLLGVRQKLGRRLSCELSLPC